jgi:arabinogalactan endo-1,4-beta-galactosidase
LLAIPLPGPDRFPRSAIDPGFEDDGTGVASPVAWQSSRSVDADYTEWGGHTGNYRLSHAQATYITGT